MSDQFPVRKNIRLKNYDCATAGMYFITVCTKNKQQIFWDNVGAAISRPGTHQLSAAGAIAEQAIQQIPLHYSCVCVGKYCIMPDHIHFILQVMADGNGRQVAAPTVSTIVGQMKRWVSRTLGTSIWQKSFIDRVIRNENAYYAVWRYIDNNPIALDFADDRIHFEEL